MIESNERRIIHFIFNPKVPLLETPFVRKYQKLLDGSLEEFDTEEKEKFQSYVERLENEELEEGETNPVVYGEMPYFTVELTALNNISFAVADDPFYKSGRSKFYPECLVFNTKG